MPKLTLLAVILSQIPFVASADVLMVPSEFPTIQAAIDAAEHGDDILIAPGTYHELLDGQNKSLTLIGAGVGQTILSGDLDDDGVTDGDTFVINDATVDLLPFITITGITFANADRAIVFGRIADITIAGCRFESCESGAISIPSLPQSNASVRSLRVLDSVFTGGQSSIYGDPRIHSITITGCEFVEITSAPLFITCDNYIMIESSFTGNSGGGLYISTTSGSISDCYFGNNTGDRIAGVQSNSVTVRSGQFLIDDCTFENNGDSPNDSVGALAIDGFPPNGISIRDCFFQGNLGALGSAISADNHWDIDNCMFANNIGADVGPINIVGRASSVNTISNSSFVNNGKLLDDGNYIPAGGGGICIESGYVNIEDSLFFNNKANMAGAIFVRNYSRISCLVNRCGFMANRAGGKGEIAGGAILATQGIGVINSVFIGNQAEGGSGGAISVGHRFAGQSPLISGCAFIDNTANNGSVVFFNPGDSQPTDEQFFLSSSIIVPTTDPVPHFANRLGAIQIDLADNIMTTDIDSIGFTRAPDDGGDGWGDDPGTPDIDESTNDDFGDLTLLPNSPAIDAGDNANLPIDIYDLDGDGDSDDELIGMIDLFGNARFADVWSIPNGHDAGENAGPIDVGPFEYQAEPCLADVNHDFVLDATDFTAWIAAYNNRGPECDQDGDSSCNYSDFSAWMDNFNAGCQ